MAHRLDGLRLFSADAMHIQKLFPSLFLLVSLAACSCFSEDEKPLMASVPAQADYVLVLKSQRQMILYSQGQPIRVYNVAIGWNPVGTKQAQGDGRTPEGKYFIDYRNPNSKFYKALHVSYPNTDDKLRAQSIGYSPGGGIMIHGIEKQLEWHVRYDRTEGCIAVSNPEIDEIWALVPDHTPIEIRA
jgi:murein L,D-transpeptidase YafK